MPFYTDKYLDKFVDCTGCNKRYTISYKKTQKFVKTICAFCGKHNTHNVERKNS